MSVHVTDRERRADPRRARRTSAPPGRREVAAAQRLLALQRTAGNAAASRLLQRSVGFEFETNQVFCREFQEGGKTKRPVPNDVKQRDQNDFPTRNAWLNHLEAGQVSLPKGPSGQFLKHKDFSVEPDDSRGPHDSNCEIVTTAFPETPAGRARLVAALGAMRAMEARLPNFPLYGQGDQVATAADLAGNGISVTSRGRGVYLRQFNTEWRGAPQMTMGLGLKDIPEFVKDLVGRPPGQTEHHKTSRQRGRDIVFAHGSATNHAALGLAHADRLAHKAWNAYAGIDANAPRSRELRGFLTLLYSIPETVRLINAAAHQGTVGRVPYLKSVSDLLAKTDYATMFKQLPKADRAYYGSAAPGQAEPRLLALVRAAGAPYTVLYRPLIDLDAQEAIDLNLPAGDQRWYQSLSIGAWLREIPRGTDLLTTKGFAKKVRAIPAGMGVEGFGPLGDRTDKYKAGARHRPILEFRSFNKMMNLADFDTVAPKLFDYVVSLNAGETGTQRRAKLQ